MNLEDIGAWGPAVHVVSDLAPEQQQQYPPW